VQRIIHKYGLLAHLPFEITPHVFRHSYAHSTYLTAGWRT
jgi:site-specific recombinase XerD